MSKIKKFYRCPDCKYTFDPTIYDKQDTICCPKCNEEWHHIFYVKLLGTNKNNASNPFYFKGNTYKT